MYKCIYLGQQLISYELKRKNVKNINLRISKDRGITVSANFLVSEKDIEKFLLSKSAFILNSVQKFKAMNGLLLSLDNGETFNFIGKTIHIIVSKNNTNQCKIVGSTLFLFLQDTTDDDIKKKLFIKWMKSECDKLVINTLDEVFPNFSKYNLTKPTISFKLMKSRWGSCNYIKNKLTFNTRLIFTSKECVEYVVVHELAHLIEHNHSQDFYNIVNEFLPDYKERIKTLRKFERKGEFI